MNWAHDAREPGTAVTHAPPRASHSIHAGFATPDEVDIAVELGRVLSQPAELRLQAADSLLVGAADNPATVLRMAELLCRNDPTFVREHGHTAITVLVAAGAFTAAQQFAEHGGPERSAWMRVVFTQWAKAQPAEATAAARALNDNDALEAVERETQ